MNKLLLAAIVYATTSTIAVAKETTLEVTMSSPYEYQYSVYVNNSNVTEYINKITCQTQSNLSENVRICYYEIASRYAAPVGKANQVGYLSSDGKSIFFNN